MVLTYTNNFRHIQIVPTHTMIPNVYISDQTYMDDSSYTYDSRQWVPTYTKTLKRHIINKFFEMSVY